ncbi:unnamed protein product, partial [Symbiodinium microadriaticum]
EREDLEAELARWKSRVQRVESEIKQLNVREKMLNHKLDMSTRSEIDHEVEEIPPGPECLQFVDGNAFNFISMLIVFMNVVVMFGKHFWDPMISIRGDLWYVDQAFLIFYVIELGLRFALWHDSLLFHRPLWKTWSFWLDTVIVLVSILEQWLLPLFFNHEGMGFGAFRILRIFRFARVLRVCSKVNNAGSSWAENDYFMAFVMCVIFLNCLMMGVQEDFPNLSCWVYFENLFLGIFMFEIIIRISHFGIRFFYND